MHLVAADSVQHAGEAHMPDDAIRIRDAADEAMETELQLCSIAWLHRLQGLDINTIGVCRHAISQLLGCFLWECKMRSTMRWDS